MSDSEEHHFESKADAGASKTYPMQAGAIRKGGHIVIKNRPCKVFTSVSIGSWYCLTLRAIAILIRLCEVVLAVRSKKSCSSRNMMRSGDIVISLCAYGSMLILFSVNNSWELSWAVNFSSNL
jgi:hypothetical protein